MKNTDLGQISKALRQSKLMFSKFLKTGRVTRKSPSKKKAVIVSKATLTRQEKPLVTEEIKRKVTEILKKGLYDKIKLISLGW